MQIPLKAAAWTAGVVISGAAFGVGWIAQDVTLPLWGLLALTFVPTKKFIETFNSLLAAAQRRAEPPKDGRS